MNRKTLFSVYVVMLLTAGIASAQRIERTINEAWRFTRDGKVAEIVNIPHSWNTEDCLDDTPGYFRGVGCYEKNLRINEEVASRSFYLHFEGANQITELWVNDNYVGKHIGGYSAFCFDITKSLRQGDNKLKIKVDNSHNLDVPPLSADFTFFGGIYRDINLIVTPKTHISTTHYASSGVYISTPQVSAESAKVLLRTMLTNNAERKAVVYVCHKIVAPDGKIVGETKSKVSLASGEENVEHRAECELVAPQLWSPDEPNLYKVYTSLCDKSGNELDKVLNVMGVRSFNIDPKSGFYINGKRYKLLGTNRHQDYAGVSNALSDAQHIADIRDIKALGSNFLRISHYPQDRLIPRLCDRFGIVTSIEIPIVDRVTASDGFRQNSLEMIREMVYQDFNSPSVMIWAYMNEVLLRPPVKKGDEEGLKEYYAEVCSQAVAIEKLLDEIDPSRLTMLPCHRTWRVYEAAGMLNLPDIIGWNLYLGWYSGAIDRLEFTMNKLYNLHPDKGFIVSEYGADMDLRLHTMQPLQRDYTCEYGIKFHSHYLGDILRNDYVIGANMWNYADFHSERRLDGVPRINNKGLVDISREKKDVYYLHAAAYHQTPYLKIGGESWRNRGGATEGGICRQYVHLFSNAKSVELRHNGKSLGEKEVVNFVAEFEVPFVDGANCLEAVAKRDGVELRDKVQLPFKGYPREIRADFEELNVLLGTMRYFDDRKDNIAWIPEQEYRAGSWGYVGGEVNYTTSSSGRTKYPTTIDIDFINSENDPIWQTQRKNMEAFKADVPDGKYCVMLYFAEWKSDKKKEVLANMLGSGGGYSEGVANRIFDVAINGVTVLDDYDITAETGAEYGITKKFTVDVDGGKGLTIGFTPIKGEPTLCAVRIYKVF